MVHALCLASSHLYSLGWLFSYYLINLYLASLPCYLKFYVFLKLMPLTSPIPKRVQNVISEAWSYQTNCCPDNEADGQQQSEESQMQPISANGISHAGIDTQIVQYAAHPPLGTGHAMVWTSHFNSCSWSLCL